MKRWALIKNNYVDIVVEQIDKPVVFAVNGAFWIDVTGLYVGPNFKYEDGKFIKPVDESLSITMNRLEVIELLDDDYVSIVEASKNDVEVAVWLEKFKLKDTFNFTTDQTVRSNFQFLQNKNLISKTKLDTLLITPP